MAARNREEEDQTIEIRYHIQCDDDTSHEFRVVLNARTLEQVRRAEDEPPAWTRLGDWDEGGCELDPTTHSHCPLAVALADVVERFRALLSYTEVTATIETP
ncbi:MAG TPA: hypothetical protein PKL84_10360, partial [Candidatus Hydrogenedentes bacterium]|nr:hypothetical protein [Candidatus Hydrogenedentota bacterium]